MHMLARETGTAIHMAHRPARDGAPTLAFSNSLGTDFRVWDLLVAALPPEFGIVRYDSRGHGLSSLGRTPYAVDDHVDDLRAVLDEAGAHKVILVGLSVGGLTAQAFALTHPERLSALVLMCTGARIMDAESWGQRMAAVAEGGLEPLVETSMGFWFTARFRTADNPLYQAMRTMFRRQSPSGYAAMCATLRDTELWDKIGAIAVPTLAIAGAQDVPTPPALVRTTAELIPGARFVEIEDAAHIPCVERPDRTAQIITGFLAEIGLAPPAVS